MWGNILTEVSYMQNFNMGFSNSKADVLIHLTQWQYWWWFWFAFLWVLYYLLVARSFRYRTLKFNPRIASTLRPHGKWGDLLTCIIPVTWCINILINSNFILKLIEWQSESSLFTLRVRAKQWYWIYKLDLRNISDIFSTPRNLGRNKWQFSTFGDLQTAEDYLHILQMRAYSSWSKDFWKELDKKSIKKNKFNITSPVELYKTEFLNNNNTTNIYNKLQQVAYNFNQNPRLITKDSVYESLKLIHTNDNLLLLDDYNLVCSFIKLEENNFLNSGKNFSKKNDLIFTNNFNNKLLGLNFFKKSKLIKLEKKSPEKTFTKNIKNFDSSTNPAFTNFFMDNITKTDRQTTLIKHSDMDDETRILRRSFGKTTPIRVLKYPTNNLFFINSSRSEVPTDIELFRFRFNDKKPSLANKPIKPTVYLTFKQKRYNQRVNIGKKTTIFFDNNKQKQTYSGNPFLKNNSIVEENFGNPTKQYRLVKKAKSRVDTTRVAGWNRLLRSRRVLVLPAHVNITVITNSFDVVHSWHIPGLGLKMDCLPGRATHHTLYIDNVGLYYGQCAEVCGRYHHHMPIRVCALPFEHFLVWWHTFGLPKFLFPADKDKVKFSSSKFFSRKFSW